MGGCLGIKEQGQTNQVASLGRRALHYNISYFDCLDGHTHL